MNPISPIGANRSHSTWDLLTEFGFQSNPDAYSDIRPGLAYDFGRGFRLTASAVMSARFQPVVLFTGVVTTARMIASVEFELPRQVASPELLAAFLAYHLDKQAGERARFEPAFPTPWLQLGRDNAELLPWVRKLRALEAEQRLFAVRPHCYVAKTFARPLLKALAEAASRAAPDCIVFFSFDGEVLKVRCERHVFAAAGEGPAWLEEVGIAANLLVEVAPRFLGPTVCFDTWQGRFRIARRAFTPFSPSDTHEYQKITPDKVKCVITPESSTKLVALADQPVSAELTAARAKAKAAFHSLDTSATATPFAPSISAEADKALDDAFDGLLGMPEELDGTRRSKRFDNPTPPT